MSNRREMIQKVLQVAGEKKGKWHISKTWKFALSALGILAAVGGIIYAVYRHSNQKYLEEFEDNLYDEDEDEYDEFLSNGYEEFEEEDDDEDPIDTENLGEDESAPDLTGSAYDEHQEEEEELTF